VASVLSSVVLAICGRRDSGSAAGPINGPSQWIYGEQAAYRRRATLRHTALGYTIHHLTSLGWATLHEKHVAGLTEGKRLPYRLAAPLATAALACWVDYRVARGRLQPGFDKQLRKSSLLFVYTAFAMGLAAAQSLRMRTTIQRRMRTMERVEKVIEVDCPISTVYNQWTQFEEFPRFMAGVKEVRQLDDTHVRWHAEIWGKDEEWDAEITEQEPDKRISWKSVSGASNSGTVRFEPISPQRTRVRLVMAYEPHGAIENIGDALGIFSARVQNTVEDFKQFIESRGRETGGWRGEIDHSRTQ
jgi:uncharacterized membrane protein